MLYLRKLYYVLFNREPSFAFKIKMARRYIDSIKRLQHSTAGGLKGYRRLSFLVDLHLIESLPEKERRWIDAESICYVMHEIRLSHAYMSNAISNDSDGCVMFDASYSPYNEHLEYDVVQSVFGGNSHAYY